MFDKISYFKWASFFPFCALIKIDTYFIFFWNKDSVQLISNLFDEMLKRDLIWEWKPNQFGYKAQLILNLLNYGVIFSISCLLVTNVRFWENSILISVGGSENGRKGKKLNLSLIFLFLWSFLHDIQSLNNQLKKSGYLYLYYYLRGFSCLDWIFFVPKYPQIQMSTTK